MTRENLSRNATRTRILDAAERLIETSPAEKFKVSDIASEAGVSPSLVIQYFKSKDELVLEAAVRRFQRIMPEAYVDFLDDRSSGTIWSFLEYSLDMDLRQSHVVRDVYRMSWVWSAEDEVRLRSALDPRFAALRRMLDRELPDEGGERVQLAVDTVSDLYTAALRLVCVGAIDRNGALRRLRDTLDPLLSGLRSRAG